MVPRSIYVVKFIEKGNLAALKDLGDLVDQCVRCSNAG